MSEYVKPDQTNIVSSTEPIFGNSWIERCWACGTRECEPGRAYCSHCRLLGLSTPWIPCSEPGCTYVFKRLYRGQNLGLCVHHKKGK